MKIVRFREAQLYEDLKPIIVRGLGLQGITDAGPSSAWTGMSHSLSGGGCDMDAAPLILSGGEDFRHAQS